MAAPKQTDPQFKLRLPPLLKANIEAAADANGRSMNAEIIWRLERSFMTRAEIQHADVVAEIRALRERLDKLQEKAERDSPDD